MPSTARRWYRVRRSPSNDGVRYPPGVREVVLPYGRTPYHLRLRGDVRVAEAASPRGPAEDLGAVLARALDAPIRSARIEARARPGDRVTVVVSDATRTEPRAEMLAAVRTRLAGVRLTVAVATGTHGPCAVDRLGVPAALLAGATLVMHDGHRDDDLVALGTTARGTPVRIHRCAVEADLVVATGAIRPHYFAGFGAGAKAIFPGLGGAAEIRINHRLKAAPGARPGVVVGNPCREDLEEAVALLPAAPFLLDVVCDAEGVPRAAVAGDVVAAFRAGVERARPWFTASAAPSRWIVVSDRLPLTGSLYQASKLVASVASLLEPGGMIVVAAECPEGIGPVAVVNEAIYELGLRPRLPAAHTIVLVSGLDARTVAPSYARWAPSAEAALAGADGPVLVAPRAGHLLL
jgi:lactate racemase